MEKRSHNNRANLTIQFPNLPLAVYKEIAAHLCQVEEVETKLLLASGTKFNYHDSQVESLQIELPTAQKQSREQVEKILVHYQNIFGAALTE